MKVSFMLPTRRNFLASLGATVAGYTTLQCQNQTAFSTKRPNVIVIYTDDQDFDEIGCYGGDVLTPHIDSLAHDGTMFTNYFASAPVCTPSRYGLLTGQYASRCQGLQDGYPVTDQALIRWNTNLMVDDVTIAKVLRQHGYATGMVGKWHNGVPALEEVSSDADHNDPAIQVLLQENYQRICAHVRACGGFEYAESIYGKNYRTLPIPTSLMYHNQDWITQGALNFIEQNTDRPFFLYMSTTLTHDPNPLASLKADPRITPAGLLDTAPDVQPSRIDLLRRAEQAGYQEENGQKGSWAGLAWLDDGVGAVLQKLDQLGLADDTMIIFSSDHASRGKMTINEGAVPCCIRWNGTLPAGAVCDEVVANIDVVPTILDVCGIAPPVDSHIDGQSMLPVLKNEPGPRRDSLYLEITYTRGVVTRDWKYIATRFPEHIRKQFTPETRREWSQEGMTHIMDGPKGHKHEVRVRYNANIDFPGYFDDDQLYNRQTDSHEQHNLAMDPQYSEVLRNMQHRLADYSQSLPHPFGEFTSVKG